MVPTFKILADFDAAEEAADCRYLDNGDVNADALDYGKLMEECRKLGDID